MVAKLKWVRISNDTIEPHCCELCVICAFGKCLRPTSAMENPHSLSFSHNHIHTENENFGGFVGLKSKREAMATAMVTKTHFKMMIPIHLFTLNRRKIRSRNSSIHKFVSSIKFDQIYIVFFSLSGSSVCWARLVTERMSKEPHENRPKIWFVYFKASTSS